jgi:hypothetical protein
VNLGPLFALRGLGLSLRLLRLPQFSLDLLSLLFGELQEVLFDVFLLLQLFVLLYQLCFELGVVVRGDQVLQKVLGVLPFLQKLEYFQFGNREVPSFRGHLPTLLLLSSDKIFEASCLLDFLLFLQDLFSFG